MSKLSEKDLLEFLQWINNSPRFVLCEREGQNLYGTDVDEIIDAYERQPVTPSDRPLFLFWCETDDHDEDWFIVEYDEKNAMEQHEEFEGYEMGAAWATLICEVPKDAPDQKLGAPSRDLLIACGGKFLEEGDARVVEINGTVYSEGPMESRVREADETLRQLHQGNITKH